MNHQIEYKITPTAVEALSSAEIDHILHETCERAFAECDWKPGKCIRMNFTRLGRGFAIALDYRVDGRFKAIIGLPQEVLGPWPNGVTQ